MVLLPLMVSAERKSLALGLVWTSRNRANAPNMAVVLQVRRGVMDPHSTRLEKACLHVGPVGHGFTRLG